MTDEIVTQQEQTTESVQVESEPTQQELAVKEETTESAPVETSEPVEEIDQTTEKEGSEPDESKKTESDSDKMRNELITQRRKRQELEQRLAYYESKNNDQTQPVEGSENSEPKIEDFDDYDQFQREHTRFIARQEINNQNKIVAEQEEKRKVEMTYQQRMSEAIKADPSLVQKIDSATYPPQIVQSMTENGTIDEIKSSEKGPQLAAYVAENPEFAYKLAGMSNREAIRTIARLEARLMTPSQQPQIKKTSQAPKPIVPNVGSGSTPVKSIDDMTAAEWAAYRNKQEFGR